MADKTLRKMNRMELIEIIYALQQNEKEIQTQNDELIHQLEDQALQLENCGGNRIVQCESEKLDSPSESVFYETQEKLRSFEAALQETEERLRSARDQLRQTEEKCAAIKEQTVKYSAEILQQAKLRAEKIQEQAEEGDRQIREQARREMEASAGKFWKDVEAVLRKYPELAERLFEERSGQAVRVQAGMYQRARTNECKESHI